MMYIYVNNKDKTTYGNSVTDFVIQLPHPTILSREWSCAVLQVILKEEIGEELYILSDIVQDSVVFGKLVSVLRSFSESEQFIKPYYIPLKTSDITQFKIMIRTKDGKIPTPHIKQLQHLCIVLHFKM